MSFDVTWGHGGKGDPAIQIHHYDERTVILRQSRAVNYEAPFLVLLIGDERALLLDTGATAHPELFPLRETIDNLLPDGYELIVAHSHPHGDHVAADGRFAGRPRTTVVGHGVDDVRAYFGFGPDWPAGTVSLDLGGRVLEIAGSPGHHAAAISVFDPRTGLLLTGDTVLPGRLYVADAQAFVATLDRLVEVAETRGVTHVLGCHVEMRTRPGRDYPIGAPRQPDERAPQMTVDQLRAVRDAAHAVQGRRGVHRFDDFLIYNEPRRIDKFRLIGRGLVHQAFSRIATTRAGAA